MIWLSALPTSSGTRLAWNIAGHGSRGNMYPVGSHNGNEMLWPRNGSIFCSQLSGQNMAGGPGQARGAGGWILPGTRKSGSWKCL